MISLFLSGERGIRTPGTSRYNGFQDRRIRPLCHFSAANVELIFILQKEIHNNIKLFFSISFNSMNTSDNLSSKYFLFNYQSSNFS